MAGYLVKFSRVERVNADGSLFTGLLQAVKYLRPVKGLASPIFLYDHWDHVFDALVGSESLAALQALPPSANGFSFLACAGINDLVFEVSAERALH